MESVILRSAGREAVGATKNLVFTHQGAPLASNKTPRSALRASLGVTGSLSNVQPKSLNQRYTALTDRLLTLTPGCAIIPATRRTVTPQSLDRLGGEPSMGWCLCPDPRFVGTARESAD